MSQNVNALLAASSFVQLAESNEEELVFAVVANCGNEDCKSEFPSPILIIGPVESSGAVVPVCADCSTMIELEEEV